MTRCSSLPLICACPAAAQAPDLKIEGDMSAAELGTAVHECLAESIRSDNHHVNHVEICAKYGVDPQDAAPLVWNGWKLWQRIEPHFPRPITEVKLADELLGLSGTMDVMSAGPSALMIADHKSGFVDRDCDDQLRGYALLGLSKHPEYDRAYVAVLRCRERTIDGRWYERKELADWWARVELSDDKTYRPGRHCGHCPRALECPARQKLLTSSVDALALAPLDGLPLDGPGRANAIGHLYDQLKTVEAMCKAVDKLIHAEVESLGGRLEFGDRCLQLVEQKRREINVRDGWAILAEELGDRCLDMLSISKTELEKAIKDKAPPRQKGKQVAAVMDRLRAAGAIVEKTFFTLESKRNVISNTDTGIPASITAGDPAGEIAGPGNDW